jgi:copper(I)-binding protein
MHLFQHLAATAALSLLCAGVAAQGGAVTVKDAWVRGTVPQQRASGLFAHITSERAARLVAASSPVAGVVEIHEMRMEGTTMRMRAVNALELPAGKSVALAPGGYHIMLMELKQQLKPGETVPVTLTIESAGGARESVQVQAQVRALNAPAGEAAGGAHKH